MVSPEFMSVYFQVWPDHKHRCAGGANKIRNDGAAEKEQYIIQRSRGHFKIYKYTARNRK